MIDPLGKLIAEIRANAAVLAIVGLDGAGRERVRGGEPAPPVVRQSDGVVLDEGDARGPGKYVAFVVLVRLGSQRHRRLPTQVVRIGVSCYGVTFQQAAQLYGAVSDAVHNIGPRIAATGTKVVIYRSFDDIDSGAEKDPDTKQPVERGVIELAAATQAAA